MTKLVSKENSNNKQISKSGNSISKSRLRYRVPATMGLLGRPMRLSMNQICSDSDEDEDETPTLMPENNHIYSSSIRDSSSKPPVSSSTRDSSSNHSIPSTREPRSNHSISSTRDSSSNHSISSTRDSSSNHSISSSIRDSSSNHSISSSIRDSSSNHSISSTRESRSNHSISSTREPRSTPSISSTRESRSNHSISSTRDSSSNPSISSSIRESRSNHSISSSRESHSNHSISSTRDSRQTSIPSSRESLSKPLVFHTSLVPSKSSTQISSENSLSTISSTFKSSSNVFTVNNHTYQVLKPIGTGGSAEVYHVLRDKNEFALKVVNLEKPKNDAGDEAWRSYKQKIKSYEREINLLNILRDNDRTIRLEECQVIDDRILIVLERGEIDLKTLIDNEKKQNNNKLGENWIRIYWEKMLEAVASIHSKRVVHCDLKPANFLSVSANLKLIDFGIAQQIPEGKDGISQNQGTMNYIAPETLMGGNGITTSADIWSLGCILYSMVFGDTPFKHIHFQDGHKKATAIIGNRKSPLEIPYHPNEALRDTLRLCLQRIPSKRATASDLLRHSFVHPSAVDINSVISNLNLNLSPNSLKKFKNAIDAANKKS